jgi:acetoin utilization deacetylase AcuC-like enzyme
VRVFYSDEYALARFGFDTTRKARWIAESLRAEPLEDVMLEAPRAVTEAELQRVHDPQYVAAVREGRPAYLARSQGFPWDPGLWTSVLASSGGVVEAARAALVDGVAGTLSSGLHHASYRRGKGFCTFNGLALAALVALDEGAESVLILDFDAHCGGGTYALVQQDERIWHVDVSVDPFDYFSPRGRHTLDLVVDPTRYLPTIEARLAGLEARAPRFGLCVYNAGMDPHEGCAVGGLPGITDEDLAERERVVFEWCRGRGIPVAFAVAGGYISPRLSREELVGLHRLTLEAGAALSTDTPNDGGTGENE